MVNCCWISLTSLGQADCFVSILDSSLSTTAVAACHNCMRRKFKTFCWFLELQSPFECFIVSKFLVQLNTETPSSLHSLLARMRALARPLIRPIHILQWSGFPLLGFCFCRIHNICPQRWAVVMSFWVWFVSIRDVFGKAINCFPHLLWADGLTDTQHLKCFNCWVDVADSVLVFSSCSSGQRPEWVSCRHTYPMLLLSLIF